MKLCSAISAMALILSLLLPCVAHAVMEQYGFDSWVEGWAPTTNSSMQAITNAVQAPATFYSWFNEGANCLRIDCDIRTNANRNLGRVLVDMRKDLGFSIPVPANLSNHVFRYKMIWPTGGDNARGTNRYRFFTTDVNGKFQYYGWYNVATGGVYVDAGLIIRATNGTEDAGYDPCRIVNVGLDVATGAGSTGTYRGPIYVESVQFDAPPARCPTPTNQMYSFDTTSEGFQLQTWWDSQAITNLYRTTAGPSNASGCLAMDVNLNWNTTNRTKGEVYVDLANSAPTNMPTMVIPADLDGKVVQAWVYCPAGLRGPETNRNTLQLFCKDSSWRSFYGTPEHVVSNYWMCVAMTPGTNAAYQGWKQDGFDASQVRLIGLKLSTASGGNATYSGRMYLDALSFGAQPAPVTPFSPPTNEVYSFAAGDEGFELQTWQDSQACTALARVVSGPANTTACLAVSVHLHEDTTNFGKGEVFLDMAQHLPNGIVIPANLRDRAVTAWVYCPAPLGGPGTNPNSVQVFCKDANWKALYGSPVQVVQESWMPVSVTPGTNAPAGGWMQDGFDPAQIRLVGVKIGAGTDSGARYDGMMYVDGIGFTPIPEAVITNDLRYGFEPNKEGWEALSYPELTGIVSVAQSTNAALEGTHSLRLNVSIAGATNRQKGVAKVDMIWFPPPSVRAPFNLDGSNIHAYVWCPPGSESTNPSQPNEVKLYVKSGTNYLAEFGAPSLIRNGMWVKVSLTPSTNSPDGGYMQDGFSPTNIVELGVSIEMGNYQGPLYLDNVGFAAAPPPMPPTQHGYSFEADTQQQWWKWIAAPVGWDALAWTNAYYATNAGYNGSVALAANAVFAPTNAPYNERKGVFTIQYNPPLNLSTKTHRIFQAKVKFVPPVEGSAAFDTSLNVYDKITDQWYARYFKTGGSGWNILEFDLDDPGEYDQGRSPIPMDPSRIGALTVQVFGNQAWTGTVYLDDVVIGGEESGTNYNVMTSDFVRADGNHFILNNKRYYFAGANAEYMFSVYDSVCEELFNDATNLHLGVVRTWAFHEGQEYSFQPKRGVWNELAFEHLDRIVAMAGHRGVRLLLGLADNWGHNGGMYQYVNWVREEHPESLNTNYAVGSVMYHDQWYTNPYCRQWYRDFVTVLLNRTNSITKRVYKNDPTVFGWEIVNEPRCESDYTGATIHEWQHTMSDWVRTVDTNHLLAGGEEGGYVKTYDEADAVPWETYPDNYYHYGVHGVGEDYCTEVGCGRGHGVDFLSDMSSESRLVTWQGGTVSNRGQIFSEWRAGNSNLNFTTCRIYVDQKEYNVFQTNVFGADQRIEWINDHVFDSHQVIRKPIILEEYGIHSVGWIYNGSFGQIQFKRVPPYSEQDRVDIFQMYFDHIEATDMAGSFYWNMGYKGMWEDPFDLCETPTGWVANANSGAASVSSTTNFMIQGTNAFRLSYTGSAAFTNTAIFTLETEQQWIVREVDGQAKGINRVKFFWNFYNPGPAIRMALALRGTTNWTLALAPEQTLTTGWNRVMFDLSGEYWAVEAGGWYPGWTLIDVKDGRNKNLLEDVRQVGVVLRGLPTGAGSVYMDNITITRDTGFVIFMDDPVCANIRAHADRMIARCVPTNRPSNHAPVASNLLVTVDAARPTRVRLGAADADGDPVSYYVVTKPTRGWIFGTPPNMTYTPTPGVAGPDSFTYLVDDGSAKSAEAVVRLVPTSLDTIQFDFESQAEGWYANCTPWSGYAVTSVAQTVETALTGVGSLRANIRLNAGAPTNAGDAEVDMLATPPLNVTAPVNLNGVTLRISVFCPTGARGNPANPNRLQIYVKDTDWRAEYTVETNIVENEWITYTMRVSTTAPAGGWMADGFRPDLIRAVGVRIKCGGTNSAYTGPIYIDSVSFPVSGRPLYGFDSGLQGWSSEERGSGNPIMTWTNSTGHPGLGAMVVTPTAGSGYGKYYIKDGDRYDHQDLFYKPIYRAYLWVPADAPTDIHNAPRVRLFLRSAADGWSYDCTSDEYLLLPGQWNLITWDMSSIPLNILRDADEWGMELTWPNRSVWNGPIIVDSIQNVEKMPAAAPAVASVTASTNSVGKYKRLELAVGLNNVQGLNPYNPHVVDLAGTFTSPSGKVWKVNGFYMEEAGDAFGQGEWKIRFAPNETGTWTYRVSVANGRSTNTSVGGSFTCVASDKHGWVRVSDNDSHYLEHDDDSSFIGKGYCRCWDGEDEGFFKEAADHGINMIHWWMAPWDTMLTVKPAYPWETWREKSSYDTYEQGRAAKLDRVIGNAEKHNVKLVFTIWPHDAIRDFNYHKWRLNGSWQRAVDRKASEPEWYVNAFSELDDPPKNQKFFHDATYKEYQDRLYRYIIARWGYSEAIGSWALVSEMFGTFANSINSVEYQDPLWVTNKLALFGEDPYQHMDTQQTDGNDYGPSWLAYINGYFKTNDPFRHPTTASYATDEYWEQGFPIVDIPQIHTYADIYSWITPPVTLGKYHHYLGKHYNKPAFMGEIGTVEWRTFEPDYTRVTVWPGLCSGAAIAPLMWTTPPFSQFGDAKMGPWLGVMSDELKVLSEFAADINFNKLNLTPADVETAVAGEPAVTQVESFESGMNNWQTWGPAVTSTAFTNAHATHGTNALRLNIDMLPWRLMPDGASGIQKYESDGFSYNWSNIWPRGTLKMDVYIPEFYHPTNNPDGFLLGINKDPRSIVEIFTKDAQGNWHWYSTTNEYGGNLREAKGWKKLTVGMLWNLELPLSHIPTAYEAAHITGMKFWFGDVGILKGPIYVDNITAGMYAFNTLAMVSSNGQFAFGWIQDRRWTNTVINSGATLKLNGLAAGNYNVEWWDTLTGPRETFNAGAPTGTLVVTVPDFMKDVAFKVRRVGAVGATVHDVAVAKVMEYDWVVRNPRQLIEVLVANQGTVAETFNVTLTDTTAGQVVGTNSVTLAAGASVHTRFWWNCMANPTNGDHVLTATASAVAGETDTADNTMSGRTMVYAQTPPWDPCSALRRWGPDSIDSDGRALTVVTNFATEGRESFQFYHRSPNKEQAYFGFDQIYENWSNRTAFMFDLYNADGSTNVQVLMRTGSEWAWYFSQVVTITNGWNRNITFRFDSNTWTRSAWNSVTQSNEYFTGVRAGGLEEVQQLFIKLTGYTNDGSVYVDNMRLDGLYTLRLAFMNGVDVFPKAIAQQSNYTGAASCWMIARYLNGDSFTQSQSQIYNSNARDPAHGGEITPWSTASWMYTNVPSGYYFSARYRTSLTDALKEAVYWMDYIPGGGLKTPVYIVSGTNWSYKVVRGFQASTKPYGSPYSMFTVNGMWLVDPRLGGLGYDVYATAQEMENVYVPSMANGEYWMVAEPPPDADAVSDAVDRMDASTVVLGGAEPNAEVARALSSMFSRPSKTIGDSSPERAGGGSAPAGITNLLSVVPEALRADEFFMAAYNSAPVVTYYEVNRGLASHYYLAAGGVVGPASTKYVIKLAPDGSFQQATWSKDTMLYPFVPVEAAVWSAQQDVTNGTVISTQMVYTASASPSPFLPAWQVTLQQGGQTVTNAVTQNDSVMTQDSDGDGMTDAQELYAGVNPTNRLSGFDIDGNSVGSGGGAKVTVSWPSLAGRTYSVYRGTNLKQPFSAVATGIAATAPMNTYTDAAPSSVTYYRVEVE